MEKLDSSKDEFSVLNTCVWMMFLTVGIQTIVGLMVISVVDVFGYSNLPLGVLSIRADVQAITGVITLILLVPVIKSITTPSSHYFPFEFISIKKVNKVTLTKILFVGVVYYLFENSIVSVMSIETPPLMLDVKSQVRSSYDLIMLVIAICIITPIIEEVIFRGLAYSRLVKSKVGVNGAFIITSLIFTMLHFQYELLVLIFIGFSALLFSYIRYRTENIVYCIVLHMQINTFTTVELFYF